MSGIFTGLYIEKTAIFLTMLRRSGARVKFVRWSAPVLREFEAAEIH